MNKKNRKVIIIGLDGATFDLITPWVEQGKLKTFDRLLQKGSHGILKSILPPNSASAWSSFMTGENPGKHGIIDFHYHKEGSYDLTFVSSQNRVSPAFWDITAPYGKKTGIINVPITYPPDNVNGFMISGLGAPAFSKKAVHPPELYEELKAKVPDYIIKTFVRDYIRSGHLLKCKELFIKQVQNRYECIKYLIKNKPWDLFIAVFTATDHAQHFFWKYMDPAHPLYDLNKAALYGDTIYSVYKLIDSYLSEILEELNDQTTLFIMSDHGAQPTNNKGLYLNNWLCKEGFLKFQEDKIRASDSFSPIKELISAGKKFIPRKFKNRLKAIPFLKSKVETIFRWQNIDWTKTVAYSDVQTETIRLNLKNREPMGVVELSQYNEVRETIISRLKEFSDPDTGDKIFSEIYRREELYRGPYVTLAPDIICDQGNRKFLHSVHYHANLAFKHRESIKIYLRDELAFDPSPNAVHSLNGIFIALGENIKEGSRINGAEIIDIAPTVLYLMGIPIPSDMDGKVLTSIFKDSFLQKNKMNFQEAKHREIPIESKRGYSREEEEEFKTALKDLGYF